MRRRAACHENEGPDEQKREVYRGPERRSLHAPQTRSLHSFSTISLPSPAGASPETVSCEPPAATAMYSTPAMR